MMTLVFNPAVEDLNYRGNSALHTDIPALDGLSLLNAILKPTSGSENCQTLTERAWSEVPHYYYYKTTRNTTLYDKFLHSHLNLNSSSLFMNQKFMNKEFTKNTQYPAPMSTEANRKRRAVTALAQGRKKQTCSLDPEDIIMDNFPDQSVKRVHKLDIICNIQQATDCSNQRVRIGWTQIEETTKFKTHEMITRIKLEIEPVQYSKVFEGPNFLVLAIP
jgi:hypothetical protein